MDFTIIYMVAGMSSRFGGKMKFFAEVGPNNETLIEYSLNQAIKAGFNKIIFVVGEHTEKRFKEEFKDNYKKTPIKYTFQKYDKEKRDKPWGTCDALCSAIGLVNEPFVVAVGDEIYGEKTFEILINHLKSHESEATVVTNLIETIPEKGTVNRGIFEVDKENNVIDCEEIINISRENLTEKKLNENSPTSMSIFGLHPRALELLNQELKTFKEQNQGNRKAECYLNIELAKLIKQNKIKMKLYYTSEKWIGITNPDDESKAREELKRLLK